jgi:N-acetylmuramoyl-L-alanine amidase
MNYLPVSVALVYLIKVTVISGLLYGYYRLFLRNRFFHQYNRYFLLGITLISLVLPLISLPAGYIFPLTAHNPVLSVALHAITPASWNEPAEAAGRGGLSQYRLSGQGLFPGIYLLTVGVLLYVFFRQLWYIRRLPRKYPRENMGRIAFFMTREPGTPFSFLNRLFWNEEIDLNSDRGRQIFHHEWYHIRQRHTLDLLLLKSVLVLFWINPFFYLIYREIRTIHEFLADRYAVAGGDRYEYAELLVWHSIYDRPLSLLNPFFQSSIKRRITMLTQLTSNKPGYWSRAMVLPLAFLLLCAFAVKMRPAVTAPALPPFTVVIDAGHGGIDAGAVAGDTKEKDINLALALKVKQLSPEYHVNVVLTRQTDELAGGKNDIRSSLEYRVEMAKENKADLFVSLHVNNAGGGPSAHGFSAYVSPDNAHYAESQKLGSALLDAVKPSYATDDILHQPTQGVYVLRQNPLPAVLLECGYIDNPADLAFIRDGQNQEKIARDILQGIQHYQEAQAVAK